MEKRQWGLLRDPFSDLASTTRPYLVNTAFQRAYNDLLAATRAGSGCLLLTGAPGYGKTTLLRYLLRGLPFAGIAVETFSPQPACGDTQAPVAIEHCHSFEELGEEPLQAAWAAFRAHLASRIRAGCRIAVAVDDADLLPDAILTDTLSLPATTGQLGAVLTVLMTGRLAFAPHLDDLARASGSVIDLQCRLAPLTESDVAAYIAEAMARAGGRGATPFPSSCLARITQLSNGVLMNVNNICGHALALAEQEGSETVTCEMVDRAAHEFGFDPNILDEDIHGGAGRQDQVAAASAIPGASQPRADGGASARASHPGLCEYPQAALEVDQLRVSSTSRHSSTFEHSAEPMRLPIVLEKPAPVSAAAASSPAARRQSLRAPVAAAAVLLLAVAGLAVGWPLLRTQYEPSRDRAEAAPGVLSPDAESLPPMGSPSTNAPGPVFMTTAEVIPSPAEAGAITQTPAPSALSTSTEDAPATRASAADSAEPAPPATAPAPVADDRVVTTSWATPLPRQEAGTANAPQATSESATDRALVAQQENRPSAASTPPATSPSTEIQLLLKRGDDMLAVSDVVSARLFYERAVRLNNAQAMTAMGRTFDPLVLAQRQVRGVLPEPRVAISWYQRAIAAGDLAAADHLRALANSMRSEGQLSPAEATALTRPPQ